jgi:sialic acid synthase
MKFKKNKAYVIAEIGHNHQGNIKLAKQMFKSAKEAGASAVKLQKRNNKELYTETFYNSPYENKNSFAKTYGKHREKLEFGIKEYLILKKEAKKLKLDFIVTPFDFSSVNFCKKIGIDAVKIASADLKNLPLQKEIAKLNKHIFLSTGGGNFQDVHDAYRNIIKINKRLSILHCTASYPAKIRDLNLNVIKNLKKKYPKLVIGLSDHENGIDGATIAYMLGARIFEKHFTLDRSNKGTDNAFSLEPQGLSKMIRNLNRIEKMLGDGNKKLLKSEIKPLHKMQKSIVAKSNILKGKKIKMNMVTFKSPGGGLLPCDLNKVINKVTRMKIVKDENILLKHVK